MILKGKALRDFRNYFDSKEYNLKIYYSQSPKSVQNALIIEWFDSVKLWEDVFYKEYRKTNFQDYKKATGQAIIKANEIYNKK